MSGESDFISRWSRRKLAPEEATAETVDAAVSEPDLQDQRPDDEILAELGLKHPDNLETGDDIKGFMQAAVPDRLRRIALRQLFRSRPDLAVLDGLVDYGEDFTDSATVIANLQTAYRVGKGMFTDEEIAARDAVDTKDDDAGSEAVEADVFAEDAQADDAGEPEAAALTEAAIEAPVANPQEAETDEVAAPVATDEPLETGPTRRRMSFHFTEG